MPHPHHKHSLLSYIFTSSVAVAFGVVLAFSFTLIVDKLGVAAALLSSPVVSLPDRKVSTSSALELKLSAKSYLVADLDTGKVLAVKNANQVLPIASLVKLLTALVVLDQPDQNQMAVVGQEALDTFGEAGSLRVDQAISVGELIYPLLIESSNDAAEVLARHFGRDDFIIEMNQKSQTIGLTQTSLVDPSGIGAGNVSSADDLFILLKYLSDLNQSTSSVLAITKMHDRSFENYRWVNSNEFADHANFIGGKNGHTAAAGDTFAGIFELSLSNSQNHRIAVIVLGSDDRVTDVNKILKYLSNTAIKDITVPKISTLKKATTSLVFVGDIMMDRGVKFSVNKNGIGDYDYLFHRVPFLTEADIAFANLEGPVSDKGVDKRNLYSFRMDPKSIEALVNAGFDVLSIANNHMGDWGYEAFVDTVKRLASSSIVYAGGGLNQAEAEGVKIVEKNGTKFGFVGFSDVGPNDLAAVGDRAGIVIANEESIPRVVAAAASQVDVLIASFHFGDEYKPNPNERQKKLARLAIDSGAKIVVGHHPHVIEPVEYYKDGVIVYSLGNFIFDQYFSKATMTGGVLHVDVFKKEIVRVSTSTVSLNSFFVPELDK